MRETGVTGPQLAHTDVPTTRPLDAASLTRRSRPDFQMQQVLDMHASLGGQPIDMLMPDEARRQPTAAAAVSALLAEKGRSTAPEPVARVFDHAVPGPAGDIPTRVYVPAGDAPLPVLVYFRGGGWVIGGLDDYDASARALANAARCIVVSVDYRRAPEHKFPAAHEDAYAAYRWAIERAADVGGDPARVAVAGEGVGANLAAAVSMLARDDGVRTPAHQLLVYPVADYNFDSPSYLEHANARPLNGAMMQWFFGQYLRSPHDGDTPAISPARTRDLAGLPPTTIITAEIDPLRSEGELLALRLHQSGIPIDYANYVGVTHEFFGMGALVDKAKQAVERAASNVRRTFGD